MNTTALIIEKVEFSRTVLPANEAGEEGRLETKLELTTDVYLTKNLAERVNTPLKLNSGYFLREFGINE